MNVQTNKRRKKIIFIGLCLVCLTVAAGYLSRARHRTMPTIPTQSVVPVVTTSKQVPVKAPPLQRNPTNRLLFCDIVTQAHRGRLTTVELDGPNKGQLHSYDELRCLRVDFRNGNGICLRMNPISPMNPNEAVIFDKDFKIKHIIPLAGTLSRTRVSPDGQWGAVTVFTGGDSYASSNLSTRSNLIDIQNGTMLFDLEEMVVRNKGLVIKEPDFNFWGVTFMNDNRHFYATLGTGGKIYLIKADRVTKEAEVVAEEVECPSLSPDNTRVAFKKRDPKKRGVWHLAVLDLSTLHETLLPEPTSIDQQVQWYDDRHVLYALPEYIVGQPVIMYAWIIAADGQTPPKKLYQNSDSPVMVRGSKI